MPHETHTEFEDLSPRLQHALEKIAKMEDPIEIHFIHKDGEIYPFVLGEEMEE